MQLTDVAAGFLIGLGFAILFPPAWRRLREAAAAIAERITRPPE